MNIKPKIVLARTLNPNTMMFESVYGDVSIPDEVMKKGYERRDFGLWRVLTWRDNKRNELKQKKGGVE